MMDGGIKMAGQETKGFGEKINDFIMNKIAAPLARFGEIPVVTAIKDGLVASIPIIIIGSIFLLIGMLGLPGSFTEKAVIPAFSSLTPKFLMLYNLTMNFLALYVAVAIAVSYAKIKKMDLLSSALLGLGAFLLMTIGEITDGAITVQPFSAQGLFTAIIVALLSVKIMELCIKNNIVIKMPDGVPPAVGNAFSALIPYAIVFVLTWLVRTVLGFDLVNFMAVVLTPLFAGVDNIFVFAARVFAEMLLWTVGMHGTAMVDTIFAPLRLQWVAENAAALAEGVSRYKLPYIWTTYTERMAIWPSAAWGLLFWMYFSKVKTVKVLAIAATPAALFTIVEPIIFGVPIVMNPFFLIPFVLSAAVASAVTYLSMQIGLVARVFIELPWATPPFIGGFLATGDWKAVILVMINFAIGVAIYYPFFKAFEKDQLQKQNLSL